MKCSQTLKKLSRIVWISKSQCHINLSIQWVNQNYGMEECIQRVPTPMLPTAIALNEIAKNMLPQHKTIIQPSEVIEATSLCNRLLWGVSLIMEATRVHKSCLLSLASIICIESGLFRAVERAFRNGDESWSVCTIANLMSSLFYECHFGCLDTENWLELTEKMSRTYLTHYQVRL